MTAKLISLVAAALLVAADQGIKAWATAQLMPVGVMAVLPGIVENLRNMSPLYEQFLKEQAKA